MSGHGAVSHSQRSKSSEHKSDGNSSSESTISVISAVASPATVNLNAMGANIPYLAQPGRSRHGGLQSAHYNHHHHHHPHYTLHDDDVDDRDVPEWWMADDDELDEEPDALRGGNRLLKGSMGSNECYSPGGLSSKSNSFISLSMDDMALRTSVSNQGHHTPPLRVLEGALNDHHGAGSAEEDDLLMDQRSLHTVSENGEDDGGAMVMEYIEEVLDEMIDRGDIPTAVTMMVMLREHIGLILSEDEVADIVLSYLELLLSAGALMEAVNVFDATKHHELVRQYFLKTVGGERPRLIAKCVRHKEVLKSYQCQRCGQRPKCNGCGELLLDPDVLRRLRLKHSNLLIWCQICGHGGHFDCMRDWFVHREDHKCSTDGSSHRCQPVLMEMPS